MDGSGLPHLQGVHSQPPEVKPRLTKDQHDILEKHFQGQNKPNTATKKGIAESLGVPLDKINNWFQNRRAKVKQDAKKQSFSAAQAQLVQSSLHGHVESTTSVPQQSYQPDSSSADEGAGLSQVDVDNLGQPEIKHGPGCGYYPTSGNAMMNNASATPQPIPGSDELLHSLTGKAYSIHLTHDVPAALAPGLPNGSGDYLYSLNGSTDATYDFTPAIDHTLGYGSNFDGLGNAALDYQAYPANIITSLSPPLGLAPTQSSVTDNSSPCSGTKSASPYTASTSPGDSFLTSGISSWGDGAIIASAGPSFAEGNDPTNTSHLKPLAPHSNPLSEVAVYGWHEAEVPAVQSSPEQLSALHMSETHSITSAPIEHVNSNSPQAISPEDEHPHGASPNHARRNSTAALTESMDNVGIHTPQSSNSGFKQPGKKPNIAARRRRPPPSALGPAALGSSDDDSHRLGSAGLRSASYSGAPQLSPNTLSHARNNDRALRRIRSSGISKNLRSNPSSAQRSPLNVTFPEVCSPKFARHVSSQACTNLPYATSGPVVDPLTPLSPDDLALMYQIHQSSVADQASVLAQPSVLSQDVQPSFPWGHRKGLTVASPPRTPLEVGQSESFMVSLLGPPAYRDTPPQSAPASQQNFPSMCSVTQYDPVSYSGLGGDLLVPENPPSQTRRPSLPDVIGAMGVEQQMKVAMPMVTEDGQLQMAFPLQYQDMPVDTLYQPGNLHARSRAEGYSAAMALLHPGLSQGQDSANFTVHEYKAPQRPAATGPFLQPQYSQPKNYIFANQGPNDFQSS